MCCRPLFIDLFAGCGGLSLGLIKSGFQGVFAIEKNKDAFNTLYHNLNKDRIDGGYSWVDWLPTKNMTTSEVLCKKELSLLRDKVDLIAGGPPCQGFSLVGLRNPHDPRNRLTEEYIKFVSIVKPKVILLENVKGFQTAFKNSTLDIMKEPYSNYVEKEMSKLGYAVFKNIVKSSDFGVPQLRPRFVLIAIKVASDNEKWTKMSNEDFFSHLYEYADIFKSKYKLTDITTVHDAIADLSQKNKKIISCVDSKGFNQILYKEPEYKNPYLNFLRYNCSSSFSPNSLRIPNHRKETIQKFKYIQRYAEKGKTIPKQIKEKFSMRKQCFRVLSEYDVSSTITTAPDDCLHYEEPRILTVRENARIQSFPDWFEFTGPYTTGGSRRKYDCPRYTQVGNAVPPLMAEIIGGFIKEYILS